MKKLLVLLALCMVFTVVLVACEDPEQPGEETTDVTTNVTTDAPTTEPGTTEPGTETTEPTTETDPPTTTDTEPPVTTEPVVPDPDPVTTHVSFDECDMWIDTSADLANSANAVGNFFAPGSSADWDKIANVEDYNVAYIRAWGWVGFFAENVGEFGYQIDDQEPVYSADFAWATGDDVIAAAQGGGAKSASRFLIMIPVRDLSGEHTIKALVKDAVGTVEEITSFTMTKAVDPNAPLFVLDAAYLADVAVNGFAPNQIASAVVSEDGSYVTITSGQGGDPYFYPFSPGDTVVDKGAQYVVVKYRTTYSGTGTNGEFFVGSGAGPTGGADEAKFEYVADGKWQTVIVDLSTVTTVNENFDLNYLRYDFYLGAQDTSIDIAYMAAFNSVEAALAYDAQLGYEDLYTVDMNTEANAAIFDGDGFPEAGLPDATFCKLGYSNVIALGAMDLSQFVEVRISYSCDGSQATADRFAAASSLAIGLKNQATSYGQAGDDNFDGNLACTDMVFSDGGWTGIRTAVVDLSEVFYNGDVWAAIHNPEGTEVLIHSIVFVYGEKVKPMETVYYDGTNGTMDIPVEGVKYFVRGAAGQTMTIEGAYNFVVTADNLMGQSVVLQPDVLGIIKVDVPADWMSFELTIENVCGEPAYFAMSFGTSAPAENTPLALGENAVVVTVENYYCPGVDMTFTATEAGTYTFGGDDAFLWCIEKEEGFSTPWTVEMAEGETLTINVGVANVMAVEGGNGEVTINLNITKA